MPTAKGARKILEARGTRCDEQSDAYVLERVRHLPRFRWDEGEAAYVADETPSESMAAGISQAELEDICHGRKAEWSDGRPISEDQRKAACAAMNA